MAMGNKFYDIYSCDRTSFLEFLEKDKGCDTRISISLIIRLQY